MWSVDEVSTTWSLSTICRLDQNKETWKKQEEAFSGRTLLIIHTASTAEGRRNPRSVSPCLWRTFPHTDSPALFVYSSRSELCCGGCRWQLWLRMSCPQKNGNYKSATIWNLKRRQVTATVPPSLNKCYLKGSIRGWWWSSLWILRTWLFCWCERARTSQLRKTTKGDGNKHFQRILINNISSWFHCRPN